MKETIDRSSEQVQKVLKLKTDQQLIDQKLQEIVRDCIDVDLHGGSIDNLNVEKLLQASRATTAATSPVSLQDPSRHPAAE